MEDDTPKQGGRSKRFLGAKEHMKRGLSFFEKGELQAATNEFETIILHDRDYVRAYNNLGYVYRTMGNYEKALEVWEEGLKVDPSYKRLHENISGLRSFVRTQQKIAGRQSIGIEDFEAAVDWLSGNAELVEIREGRFFDVYVIENRGERYAFKTLSQILPSGRGLFEAFEKASSGWLGLSANEHVVPAQSVTRISDRPFLILEYAPEGSLREILNQPSRRKFPLLEALDMALQVCFGMHFIHAELGAHGDLRLENLLLWRAADEQAGEVGQRSLSSYTVKISDVGLWSTFQRPELFCDLKGNIIEVLAEKGLFRAPAGFLTPSVHSCAPELLETGHTPDMSTDVYAFGIAFYEMLTGISPFSGLGPAEIVREKIEESPKLPSVIERSLPPALGSICMRCLEHDTRVRYKDFSEIAGSIVSYMETVRSALGELNELCRRYKKVSRFQFEDMERNTSMMIVGGTEFSTEMDQLWEILKRRAARERDDAMLNRLQHIESVLLMPGSSIGELYPQPASAAESLLSINPEKYRQGLTALPSAREDLRQSGNGLNEPIGTAAGAQSAVESGAVEKPDNEVFGVSIAEKYSSLRQQGNLAAAVSLLADALELRAKMFLADSKQRNLSAAFEGATKSRVYYTWLNELFDELPSSGSIPSPEDFLRNEMSAPKEIVVRITGLLLMLAAEFAAALETFGISPDERYLSALDIYLWALAKFQCDTMEKIRLNSLKNASRLLKEIIVGRKESDEESRSSTPRQSTVLGDAFFLRALVFEQLGEHPRTIAHLRAWNNILKTNLNLSRQKVAWANIILGTCMCKSGLPSEGIMRWQKILTRELQPPFFAFLELGSARPSVLLANYFLKSCEQTLRQFGENATLWCVKGKLLNLMASPQDVLECAQRSLKIDENFFPAYYLKMEALLATEQYEGGLEALRVCLLREPFDPLLMLRESEILCRIGEVEAALVELKKAISHGLDLCELRRSVKMGKLTSLGRLDEFRAIIADMDQLDVG